VTPDYLDFDDRSDTTATIVASVTDSLGNVIAGEAVELNTGIGTPQTATTDSAGRAAFLVTAGTVRRGSAIQLRARGVTPAGVEVAEAAGLSGTNTGFVGPSVRRGRVGSALPEALIFEARLAPGGPAKGRIARFRALNARVSPDTAVLDSAGRTPVHVVLGQRAGEAVVFATIDSVEKLVTLQAEPGPIASLVLERNGEVVSDGRVVVTVAVPFVLRLTARDMYGNGTSIDALSRMLRANQAQLSARQRNVQLLNMEPRDASVLLTLKAQRLGMYDFTIGSGITAKVRVEAVSATF
jgi:hypothetical protein